MFASNNHKLYNYIKMSMHHTRTLNITHLKSSKNKKKHHCHCHKSHNILSQKQLCHSSLKQNYIQCIFLIALNYKYNIRMTYKIKETQY